MFRYTPIAVGTLPYTRYQDHVYFNNPKSKKHKPDTMYRHKQWAGYITGGLVIAVSLLNLLATLFGT